MKVLTCFFFALISVIDLQAQCIFNSPFGSLDVPSDGSSVTQGNIPVGNYIPVSIDADFGIPGEYTFESSRGNDYLTLTDENNNVIAHGPQPLVVSITSSLTGQFRLHIARNAGCATSGSTRRTITAYCSFCDGGLLDDLYEELTCGESFLDSGGENGDYSKNEKNITVVCPSILNTAVRVDFVSFDVRVGDELRVFDGNDVFSPLIGVFNNNNIPDFFIANNESGCLTFRFTSDNTATAAGWNTTVSCVPIIRPVDCGSTHEFLAYEFFGTELYPNASQYEFRIDDGDNLYTFTTTNNQAQFVNFVDLPTLHYEYNKSYEVSVRVEVNGEWTPFGPSCTVSTTEYPYTQVQHLCGETVTSFTQPISVLAIFSAPAYEFEVTDLNTGLVQNLIKTIAEFGGAARRFSFSNLPEHTYGTDYSIRARVLFDGTWYPYGPSCVVSTPDVVTALRDADCGRELTSLSQIVYAREVKDPDFYRFEVRNVVTNEVEIIESANRSLSLSDLPNPTYETQYEVRVQIVYKGISYPWGIVCSIFSPSQPIASIQLRSADCGRELSSIDQLVYANIIDLNSYEFEVTNLSSSEVEIISNTNRSLSLSQLTNPALDASYSVRVRAEINGELSGFGTACQLHLPAPALVLARLRSPDCGREIILMNQAIYSNRVDEDSYTFQFTNMSDMSVETITKATRDVRLSELNNPQEDQEYQVRISVVRDGEALPFGPICSVFSPSSSMFIPNNEILEAMSMEEQDAYIQGLQEKISNGEYFSDNGLLVSYYPNPFSSSGFNIQIEGAYDIDSTVDLLITDVTGKIVYKEVTTINEVLNQRYGHNLQPGIYTVSLVEANEMYIARVIKQ